MAPEIFEHPEIKPPESNITRTGHRDRLMAQLYDINEHGISSAFLQQGSKRHPMKEAQALPRLLVEDLRQ